MKKRVAVTITMLLISGSSVASVIVNYPQPAYCSRGELTPTEVTVCGSEELSKLDLELSKIIEDKGFDSDCEPTDGACLEAEAAAKAEANTD